MRVVVVGGGVIGCAAAERLARAGHRVLLLERDRIGVHASGAAAGLLAPYSEADEPGAFHRLNVRSLALFDDLTERLRTDAGIDIEFRRQATLRIAFDDAARDLLARRITWQREAGLESRLLTPEEARSEEPGLGEVAGAALFPEAQVTPPRLVAALARAAAAAGAEIREGTPAVALIHDARHVTGVRLPDREEPADVVVLAAGPWSPHVGLTAGLELPIKPRRGQLVALAPPARVLRHMLTAGHLYLVPKPAGEIICGSTEEDVNFAAEPTAGGIGRLLGFAVQAIPALKSVRIDRLWAALRPAPPGPLPLIGPSELEGLVLATGHNRNGVLQAPLTAELVERGLEGDWQDLEQIRLP